MSRRYVRQIIDVDLNGPQAKLTYLRAIHSALHRHTGHDFQSIWDELHENPDDPTHHHGVMKKHYSDWINFIDIVDDGESENET